MKEYFIFKAEFATQKEIDEKMKFYDPFARKIIDYSNPFYDNTPRNLLNRVYPIDYVTYGNYIKKEYILGNYIIGTYVRGIFDIYECVIAEFIDYIKLYRVYYNLNRAFTIFYADDIESIKKYAKKCNLKLHIFKK